MPIQYDGVIAEHQAVRNAAGVFDISHMGEIMVGGAHAEDFLELCRETLFRKLDAECHKDSDWYGRLPVLAVVTTTECPHHCDDAYCFLIKFIRDSDPMTDPMPQDTLENIMEWASAIEQEIEQELMNG